MSKGVWITIIVILLVLIGGFFFWKNQMQSNNTNPGVQQGTISQGAGGMEPETQQILGNEQNTSGETSTPTTHDIAIKDFAFTPSTLTIKVGDTVTWTNFDTMSHTVTSDSGTELGSSTFGRNGKYTHTFTTAGTYPYHCKLHSGMTAKIIVE